MEDHPKRGRASFSLCNLHVWGLKFEGLGQRPKKCLVSGLDGLKKKCLRIAKPRCQRFWFPPTIPPYCIILHLLLRASGGGLFRSKLQPQPVGSRAFVHLFGEWGDRIRSILGSKVLFVAVFGRSSRSPTCNTAHFGSTRPPIPVSYMFEHLWPFLHVQHG